MAAWSVDNRLLQGLPDWLLCVAFAARVTDGHGAILMLPTREVWNFNAYEDRIEVEESVFLSSADGPRRAMQIVIYGRARKVPRVHWSFTLASAPSAGGSRHRGKLFCPALHGYARQLPSGEAREVGHIGSLSRRKSQLADLIGESEAPVVLHRARLGGVGLRVDRVDELLRDHAIAAVRYHCAGHDAHTLSALDLSVVRVPGEAAADHFQSRRAAL